MSVRGVGALVALATSAGCWLGVPPLQNAPVSGTWSMSIKNGSDACMTDGWMPGAVSSFEIKLQQFGEDNEQVSAELQGILGLAFWLGVGSSTLTGRIEGDELSLTLLGAKDEMLRGCTYRREVRVTARVQSDRLRDGRITHIIRTDAACPGISGCELQQTFDGTRIDVPVAR
ncbi:MAG: hypothetical protein SF187_30215 [Deltaproteobacteria bacterium]|nr:hypothetical protein [Deltaproteobacteria bacterium]